MNPTLFHIIEVIFVESFNNFFFYEINKKNYLVFNASSTNDDASNQMYDSSLGVVLNVDNLDIDTGENKYKRRPLFEWLARWLKSRQIANRRLFRMTRQKKIMFIIIIIFISLFTLIIIFSRLGSLNTENDPALDPMNNPNIRVE